MCLLGIQCMRIHGWWWWAYMTQIHHLMCGWHHYVMHLVAFFWCHEATCCSCSHALHNADDVGGRFQGWCQFWKQRGMARPCVWFLMCSMPEFSPAFRPVVAVTFDMRSFWCVGAHWPPWVLWGGFVLVKPNPCGLVLVWLYNKTAFVL